ncbi:uncharacterized protein ColSpa_00402 [Colletotrichum spaethianum]|uniref:Uncharacterized protein n=1 Tax=Colletotrichum spaethianum TaxID=700344 RepID=A0AA37P441_9PEZI|nr:uncharacterized protein ColSpa_00402 [Colletotrichum spaethianum]GKT40221.1 hypothetical protein ColSpa_00402 [Colletotrichum spaethianum]
MTADDHPHKDRGIRTTLNDLIDELTESICGLFWVTAFPGNVWIWIHVISTSVNKYKVGPLLERWPNMVRHEFDRHG